MVPHHLRGWVVLLFACATSTTLNLSAQDALTAEVKGVQAVLLHCWNAESRTNMKTVLASQNRFAISSAPYLKVPDKGDRNGNGNTSELVEPCTMAKGQTNRLGNVGRLMSDLATTPEFHLIIFAGNLHDPSKTTDLPKKVTAIWNELIAPRVAQSNFYFHLGASLEDYYLNRDVDGVFQSMAGGIPKDAATTFQQLVAAKRFSFHRAPNGTAGDPTNPAVDVSVGNTVVLGVPITHERHGRSPSPGYQAWSNDGPFVYWNRLDGRVTKNEKCDSDNYCGLEVKSSDAPFSLSTFKSTKLGGQFRLLWRPAYNLVPYTDRTVGSITIRTFNTTTALKSDGSASGFDPWEAQVLTELLK